MEIRRALPAEAKALSELAMRSKAHWPYDREQLSAYQKELEVFQEDIIAGSVYLGTASGHTVGFYALTSDPRSQRLHFLFVESDYIGRGFGKSLWLHAIRIARKRGWESLSLYADSYAVEAFYKYQHCRPIGSLESTLGPLIEMTYDLK